MKKSKLLLIGLILSILFILPFFDFKEGHLYLIQGDDYPFHMARIFSTISEFKHGDFFSLISFFGKKQLLYNVELFYPSLTTVMPISLFALVTKSVVNATYLYIVIVTLATFIIAYESCYYVVSKSLKEKADTFKVNTSLFFAILYVFSHYRLLCIYERFDLGEFFSLSMYPLIFAGFYSVFFDNNRKGYWLIIGMSLIAYSHILSLLLCTVILGILYLFLLVKKLASFSSTLFFLKNALLAVLLSSFALFPLANELLTLTVRSVKVHDLQKEAYNPLVILGSSSINYLGYMSIGLLLLLIQLFIFFYFYKRKKNHSAVYTNKLLFFCSISSLLFAISLTKFFPWFLIQYTPLVMIQFPFRLVAFLSIFGLYVGSVLLVNWLDEKNWLKKNIRYSFIVTVLLLSFMSLFGLKIERKNLTTMSTDQEIVSTKRYQKSVNKDYFPKEISKKTSQNIVDKVGYINGNPVTMDYTAENPYFKLTLPNKSNKVITPIISYSTVSLYDQSGNKLPVTDTDSKTFVLTLPKGNYTIYIKEQWTFIYKISLLLTLLAIIWGFIEWKKATLSVE